MLKYVKFENKVFFTIPSHLINLIKYNFRKQSNQSRQNEEKSIYSVYDLFVLPVLYMTSEQGQPGEPIKSCSRQLNNYSAVSSSSKFHNQSDLSVYRIALRHGHSGMGLRSWGKKAPGHEGYFSISVSGAFCELNQKKSKFEHPSITY